ncbi:response regulator [Anaeromyxobacter paludicola]|uniref:Response regulatory domain-containing protein n=1 Tax=Anaeromyxobacter paludicola TaxID=2918171 RepID=A0ABN6N1W9_9BACT|nr:response regulator [Anaeromyxobacter paludicola]BDG07205.1 hypothetical protein AMPC_03180 [Anaeromyxobacter paludicola]
MTARDRKTAKWDRPEEHDHVLLIADDDQHRLDLLREHLAQIPGRPRAAVLGRYPRFKLRIARDGEEVSEQLSPETTVLAIDLGMPRRSGLEVIEEVRPRRSDLAILAYTAGARATEAVAAMMAGADHFHELNDMEGFEHALELAIDRRRLAKLIERSHAEAEEARSRLARLAGMSTSLPGLRVPQDREAVIPFHVAAQRYLAASAKLYEGDARGLAEKLGVSYFAMRRLLKRFGVPLPSRPRKEGTSKG